MHKLSVYVETSVWSHVFADDAPQLQEATEKFLDDARAGRYALYISVVVLREFAPRGRRTWGSASQSR